VTRLSRRLVVLVAAGALALGLAACDAPSAPGGEVTCPDGRTVEVPDGPGMLVHTTLGVLGVDDQESSTACWLGQPLLINFWAEWCGPCRQEMPDLEAVHQALGDRVRFIGVNFEDRVPVALAFADEVGVTYELWEDPDGDWFRATGGRGAPYTLLVDAAGAVVHRHAGPVTERSLLGLLDEHLGISSPA
jgi:cytochrome c biogenesis protein CcmG, thiol:disulfide interchange protein DsbE